MGVVCNACGTEYEFALPESAAAATRPRRFRCASCGHRFMLSPERLISLALAQQQQRSEAAASEASAEDIGGFLLRRGTHVYHVRDLVTLQRWIVDRRALRDDLISAGDGRWERAEDKPELVLFFDLVDQADGKQVIVPGMTDLGFEPPSEEIPSVVLSQPSYPTPAIPVPFEPLTEDTADAAPVAPQPVIPAALSPRAALGPALPISAGPEPGSAPAMPPAAADHAEELELDWIGDEPDLTPIEEPLPADLSANEAAFFSQEAHTEDVDLLLGFSEPEQPLQPAWEPPPPRRDPIPWIIGAITALAVAALLWYSSGGSWGTPTSPAAPPSAPPPIASTTPPAPTPAPSPTPAPAPEPEPTPEPEALASAVVPPAPEPTPEPAPEPAREEVPPPSVGALTEARPPSPPQAPAAPAEPAKPSHTALIDRGWSLMNKKDWDGARSAFGEALDQKPGSAEARYGLGYTYEKMGDTTAAVSQYCRALSAGASGDSRREIEGRLGVLGQTCSE